MTSKKSHVLLGVTGSVAAVKAPDLVRRLLEQGFSVSCVMTPSAKKFVSELVLATFSGRPVIADMFGPEAYQMPHLTLSKEADVMLIAPASATVIGRCAHGLAEDMVSLCSITTTAPLVMAPAMHDTMWENPAVQANVDILKKRGVQFVGPQKGPLADRNDSVGRMSDPAEIVAALKKML